MNIIALIVICVFNIYGTTAQTPCPPASFNMLFILDESGSVGQSNYQLAVQLVIDFISNDVDTNSKRAAVAFGDVNDIIYSFNDDQTSKTGIITALQDEINDFASGFEDNAYPALVHAISQFKSIAPSNNNIIFLFADGGMITDSPVCSSTTTKAPGLEELDTLGIKIIVVTLGSSFDSSSIQCLYDSGDLLTGDFTTEALDLIETQLIDSLCGNATETETETPTQTKIPSVISDFFGNITENPVIFYGLVGLILICILITCCCLCKRCCCSNSKRA